MTAPNLHPVPQRPRTAWAADELLAAKFTPPTWAVPGIIAEGVTLLAGPPKVGKSWLAFGLGLAIAGGRPALGRIAVDAGPVLYLALEDTPRRLQNRMRKMLDGQRAPAGLTLDTWCPELPNGGVEYITGWLDENPGARMVVIDVLTKVRGAAPHGATAYQADYAAIGHVKRLADAYRVPVVLVHHVRKQASEDFLQTVSGTNGLAGAADAVLVLERGRAQADGVLHVTGRDVEEEDYAMSFDPANGAWTLLDGPAGDWEMGDTRALVVRYLRSNPGTKPAAIADALRLKPDAVRQTCRRMADAGQLTVTNGAYRAADPPNSSDTPNLSHLSLCHSTSSDQGGYL